MEDKQLICDYLTEAIRATRAGFDIHCLKYDQDKELVYVYRIDNFDKSNEPIRTINVACDSGIAMIRDIMRHIDIG